MIKLTESLKALGTNEFEVTLKNEIQNIKPNLLPLQKGLSFSSYVGDRDINVMILNVTEVGDEILVKAGVNYSGIIAGSCCADDPTTMNEQSEYCELQFKINKYKGDTSVFLLEN